MKDENLTEWFPADVKPVHRGIYETRFLRDFLHKDGGFSYWDGLRWSHQFPYPEDISSAYWGSGAIQAKEWRGLRSPA